jgi:hypothetical protein
MARFSSIPFNRGIVKMTYNIALLVDPYRGMFKVVGTANDYIEAWRQAAAARRMLQGGIFFVLSTETREDPKPLNLASSPDAPVGRRGGAWK